MTTEWWEGETCGWFAMCGNPATGVMDHPIIGDVPICDRCRALVEQTEADTRRDS